MKKSRTVKKKKKKKNNLPLFLVCIIICGALIFGVFQFHFIITPREFVIWPKTELTLEDTFADVRKWGPLDFLSHPKIAMALLNRKKVITKDRMKEMQRNFKKNKKDFEKSLQKELDKLMDF